MDLHFTSLCVRQTEHYRGQISFVFADKHMQIKDIHMFDFIADSELLNFVRCRAEGTNVIYLCYYFDCM